MDKFTQSLVNSSYAVAKKGVAEPRASGGGAKGLPRGDTVTSRSFTGNMNVGSLSWTRTERQRCSDVWGARERGDKVGVGWGEGWVRSGGVGWRWGGVERGGAGWEE